MISRNELKYYSSLLEKKFRNQEQKFIIDGKRIVSEGLHSNFKCEIVFMNNSFVTENKDLINFISSKKVRNEIINSHDFEKLSDTKNAQGIAAVFHKPEPLALTNKIIIALDNVSDPGNAGTITRNCDWFGLDNIILSENSVELYNPKALRAGMGAVFHTNILETDSLLNFTKDYRKSGYKIINTDVEGNNIFEFEFPDKFIMIFSNEAAGPSEEIFNISDYKVSIPRFGKAESLNVANASAIILAEIARRKKPIP